MTENNDKPPVQPTLLVPAELAQNVVNYLQTCPYKDVFQLISALVQCKPPEDPKAPSKKAT